jgi:hypothetical protein
MRKLISCLLIVGIVAIAGCKKEGTGAGTVSADDPLTYVPSDTPYVIANIDPQPVDVSDYWIEKIDKSGKYGDIVAEQLDNAAKIIRERATKEAADCANSGGGGSAMQDASSGHDDADADKSADAGTPQVSGMANANAGDAQTGANATSTASSTNCAQTNADREKLLKLLDAVKAEVAGKDLRGVMDMAGVSPQYHFAFFGIGLVPVARLELAKPDNLRATIGRIETASGSKMATGKVGSLDYWIVDSGKPDVPLHLVFAISGKQLVATVAPAKASDADLRTLFGLDKPAKSLADSGDLAALNKRMNYLAYGTGYFDTARLVAVLKAPPTALETSFLTALGGKEKPKVDAVCAGEYDQLAAAWPRASFGVTELSTKRVAVRGVLETRADIAKDLMTLRAPMPGMQAAQDSLFDFGFSANLTKLPDLATKYADAAAKAPWQCPQLADLNKGMEQSKTSLTNVAVTGYAPMFHGFHALVDTLVMKDDQPMPDITAVVAIGSDNPTSLLAMAGSVAPDIAKVGLKTDGVPKALPPMPGMPINAPMFAAMTEKLLAISLGAGEDAKLAAAMKLDDAQQPLFVLGAKGDVYHLIAQTMRKGAKSASDPDAQKMMEQQAKMMDMYASWFKRADIRVELTEQGIELHETVDMQ